MPVNDSLFNMDVIIFRWIGLVKSEPKSLSRDAFATLKNMPKMHLRLGLRPDPSGELTALPQTPSWIWWPLRGGKAKGKKAKGEENGRDGRE